MIWRKIVPTYIDKVWLEISQIGVEDLLIPTNPVPSHMKVIGELLPDKRALYTLAMRAEREYFGYREFLDRAIRAGLISVEQLHVELPRLAELGRRAMTLSGIFEASVADDFQLWSAKTIWICCDWQVAYAKQDLDEVVAQCLALKGVGDEQENPSVV